MSNYACRYPDGAAGLALLLVRTGYAFVAFGIAAMLPIGLLDTSILYLAAALVALLLLLGLATPWAALLLGSGVAVVLTAAGPTQQLLLAGHVGCCAAIALIGPGAFSIDARRYGRRVIHIKTHTPDRGADD